MNQKRCFKCLEIKDITEFYKHPKMVDGHLNKCKACAKHDVGVRYYTQFEKIRAYEKKRSKTLERKAKAAKYLRDHRQRNPGKDRARQLVSRHVRAGKLQKQPCAICGCEEVEAHHKDYSQPLNVTWICFRHHRAIEHQQINAFTS
jgi:hypothetical protein